MAFSLLIDSVDRSSLVELKGFSIRDNLNERVDSLKFTIRKHAGQTYLPSVGQNIEVYDGVDRIFNGVVLKIDKSLESDSIVQADIDCKDLSHFLDRHIVLERFTNTTIDAVIAFLVTRYAPEFTIANVNAPVDITNITFDRQPLSECLTRLARLAGYSWYVDYDYDIHFFERNEEPAPFNLTDTSENYIHDSLEVDIDFSQVRNRITVRGGDEIGNTRTELFDGDGTKLFFPLSNKFATKPSVLVGGLPVNVGIDFLDDELLFDCFWNFEQKYLRFKNTTVPSGGVDDVAVTGDPLFPIIITRSDSISIGLYGVYEDYQENKQLKSRDDALSFALAVLERDSFELREGGFETYTPGLRSGQIITVTNTLLGVNEDFLIQRVGVSLETKDRPKYSVDLATLRSINFISVLMDLLRDRDINDLSDDIILSFTALVDNLYVTDSINSVSSTTPPYEWGGGGSPQLYWNLGTWG